MKKIYLSAALLALGSAGYSQSFPANLEIPADWNPTAVRVPASPLKTQVIFVGAVDSVATLDANGQPNGYEPAKQWHDFIGFTPATAAEGGLGWVSVNHEMIQANAKIGDGGGMTVFKIARDPDTDTLIILDQTLADGRTGQYFNVDFANTVGETGMNCGGIVSPVDGRIWTAEEWFRTSNTQIFANGTGFTDTTDFTVGTTGLTGDFDGQTLKRFQNLNWFVEIDPRQAKAIRKQYNWSRGAYEGGILMPDNKTVYMGEDVTPGSFLKFVADEAGDFTSGKLYVFSQTTPGFWAELPNTIMANMITRRGTDLSLGSAIFDRLEWVAYNNLTGKIYIAETGVNSPGNAFRNGANAGGRVAQHHIDRARARFAFQLTGATDDSVASFIYNSGLYRDYYGRVLEFDPATNLMRSFLEGGPDYDQEQSQPVGQYPNRHLSNPDGLNFMYQNGKAYMIIQEDLIGGSFNRLPAGQTQAVCEAYLLDMSIANPSIDDLVRIVITTNGAEITGGIMTPDQKTMLINSQHPTNDLSINTFPYNNSLTVAITGWDEAITSLTEKTFAESGGFQVWPNPVARELHLNQRTDVAIYSATGQRVRVYRNVEIVDLVGLKPGVYFVRNAQGETKKIIME